MHTNPAEFEREDFVLYRDPEMFWAGKPGHTFVCRVDEVVPYTASDPRYHLICVTTGRRLKYARGGYMRLLPPQEAMRDVDTAPLKAGDAAAEMAPAAIAWLAQQQPPAVTDQCELPSPRDNYGR